MPIKIYSVRDVPAPGRKRLFTSTLLHWFRRYGRDLPWRRTRDPYRILVSEFMLQQTQVERVKDYYRRFFRKFPALEELAGAEEDDVLEVWEGLGYYNRAKNLHRTARILRDEHNGEFPRSFDELTALPGIGRYTAGAILSFAFHDTAPILDTNVERVLERIFVKRRHSSPARQEKRLWKLAESLLEREYVWEMNQALIDFGATVCTAQRPKCGGCPMKSFCMEFDRRRSPQLELPYQENGQSLGKAAEPYIPYSPDLGSDGRESREAE